MPAGPRPDRASHSRLGGKSGGTDVIRASWRARPPSPGEADGAPRPPQHGRTLRGLQGVARTRVLRMHAQSTHTSVCVNTRAHTHTLRPRTNALPWAPPQRLQPACLTREPLTVWSRLAEDGLRLLGVSASARGSRVAEGPGSGARRRSGAVPVAWVELGRASRALL